MPTDPHLDPPTAPANPGQFRASVLRRAARIERRRRVVRAAGWGLGIVAVVASGLALIEHHQQSSSPTNALNTTAAAPNQPLVVQVSNAGAGQRATSIVGGSDANLWCAVQTTDAATTSGILQLGTDGHRRFFGLPPGARPAAIVAGSDGALWFTDPGRGTVDRMATSGQLTEYRPPAAPGESITLGPDGSIWFAEPGSDDVARITTAGAITQYPTPAGHQPGPLAAGPDGDIWFGETNSPAIGRVSPAGVVSELALPDPTDRATALATGPGPAIWFAIAGDPAAIHVAHLDSEGQIIEGPARPGASLTALTLGPDGRLWYAGPQPDTIQTAGLSGTRTLLLDTTLDPGSLATGSDGNVWAVDAATGSIDRITAP